MTTVPARTPSVQGMATAANVLLIIAEKINSLLAISLLIRKRPTIVT